MSLHHFHSGAVLGLISVSMASGALAGDPGCYPLSIESSTPLGGSGHNNVTVIDEYVLLGNYSDGTQIFDISDPTSPGFVTSIPGALGMMYIHGSTLFASPLISPGGIRVYDVSDPTNPVFLTEMDVSLTDNVTYINSYDRFLFLSESQDNSMHIFDVHDPSSPALMSSIQSSFPRSVAAQGDHLYLSTIGQTAADYALEIYDISVPTSPHLISGMTGSEVGEVLDIELQGTTVYLAGGQAGFSTVDVSDPTNPTLLDSAFFFGTSGIYTVAVDFAVVGDRGYVSQFSEDFDGQDATIAFSFGIIDTADPASLRGINWISLPSNPGRETTLVRSDLAYVVGSNDLLIVDVTDGCECEVDFEPDGVLNFFDVSAFINLYAQNDPAADLTGDGVFDFFDVSAFIFGYASGCP